MSLETVKFLLKRTPNSPTVYIGRPDGSGTSVTSFEQIMILRQLAEKLTEKTGQDRFDLMSALEKKLQRGETIPLPSE